MPPDPDGSDSSEASPPESSDSGSVTTADPADDGALTCAADDADANAGSGNVGDPVTSCTWEVSVKLRVVQNATQANVQTDAVGEKTWATVKAAAGDVIVEATTDPNSEAYWHAIDWSGDSGTPGDKPNQRKLSRTTSQQLHIEAKLGGSSDALDIWVIWADIEIKIGQDDELDADNDAPVLNGSAHGQTKGEWPPAVGGGRKLGPIILGSSTLNYAYVIGKIQAKATLTPPGIENVVSRNSWRMLRTRTAMCFTNGKEYCGQKVPDVPDLSLPEFVDLDPTSGSSSGEIYDLDGPGCPDGIANIVDLTAEKYVNFKQYAAVILDTEYLCSDKYTWSYQARVDIDKEHDPVELNELSLSPIPLPSVAHYPVRKD